ncbi:hypothetical protein A4G99_01530 [Haladaptatus sp. R4]|uniref:hypothetical protein n=1 Tax=Haladaptatus sp. R4 TaxID=1679489 RepID=UPI0007B4B2F7|nr:hypothetical protein [Haladaptatus sp. R4]KZN25905.1 hypothetical protein A4G99_01530 [Haladaptatus sp. R4]
MSPTVERKSDDVLDLDLDESESPFEPVDVLGTEHEGDTLTIYTMSGGGASLVLSVKEDALSHPVAVGESDLTTPLRTGLSYLFRDGIRTVRVRVSPDSATDALATLDSASLYRYDELLFTAKIEN